MALRGNALAAVSGPATALMVVSVVFMQHGLPFQMSPVEGLVTEVLAGAATYLVALFLLDRTLGSELRIVARELLSGSRAPEGVQP